MKTKRNYAKILPALIIIASLLFSFCLSGFSSDFLDFDFGFDNGDKVGYERLAVGFVATLNGDDSTDGIAYGVELIPWENDQYFLNVYLLTASESEDETTGEYLYLSIASPEEGEDKTNFDLYYGEINNLTADETYLAYQDGDYKYEDRTEISLISRAIIRIAGFFSVLIGD